MGQVSRTNEVVIGTPDGIVKAWAVRRRPEDERWDMEAVNAIKGTPARPTPGKNDARIPIRIRLDIDDEAEVMKDMIRDEAPRRAYIRKKCYENKGTLKDARDAGE